MLHADGDFGLATDPGVRYAQDVANHYVTGMADARLWSWLESRPEPFPMLDTNGVAFIALEETGGLAYYDIHTRWPHFPGEASGITIGVGYDLRWNSQDDFLAKWGDQLSNSALDELAKDIGKRGTKKRARNFAGSASRSHSSPLGPSLSKRHCAASMTKRPVSIPPLNGFPDCAVLFW